MYVVMHWQERRQRRRARRRMVRRQRQSQFGEARLFVLPQDNFTADGMTDVHQIQTSQLSGVEEPDAVTQDNDRDAAVFQQRQSSTELHATHVLRQSAAEWLEPDTLEDNADDGFRLEPLTQLQGTEQADLLRVSCTLCVRTLYAAPDVLDPVTSLQSRSERTDYCSAEDDDDDDDNDDYTEYGSDHCTDDSTVYPTDDTSTEDSTDDSSDDSTDNSTSEDSTTDSTGTSTSEDSSSDCTGTSTSRDSSCDCTETDGCDYHIIRAANSTDTDIYDDNSTLVDDEVATWWSDWTDDFTNTDQDL